MRYEFRVDGTISEEARGAFHDLRITEQRSQTVLDGDVLDESQLHGIIAQLQALGLVVVSVYPDPD
jgi:hypothetical protein